VALRWGSGLESTLCPLHQRLFVASRNFVPDCRHRLQQLCRRCYIHSTGLPALLNHPWQLVDLQGFLCTHSGKPPFGPAEANGFNRGCRTMAKTAPSQEEFGSLERLFARYRSASQDPRLPSTVQLGIRARRDRLFQLWLEQPGHGSRSSSEDVSRSLHLPSPTLISFSRTWNYVRLTICH